MTSREADEIILDAELDLLTLPPLESFADLAAADRRRLDRLTELRRDIDDFGRRCDIEIAANRRFLYVTTFLAGFFAFLWLFA
jgi:hypothetical protein